MEYLLQTHVSTRSQTIMITFIILLNDSPQTHVIMYRLQSIHIILSWIAFIKLIYFEY